MFAAYSWIWDFRLKVVTGADGLEMAGRALCRVNLGLSTRIVKPGCAVSGLYSFLSPTAASKRHCPAFIRLNGNDSRLKFEASGLEPEAHN